MDIYKQKTENVMPHLSVISINGYVGGRQTVGVANYFLDQSIGIDDQYLSIDPKINFPRYFNAQNA